MKFVKSSHRCIKGKKADEWCPRRIFFLQLHPYHLLTLTETQLILVYHEAVDGNERGTYWYPAEGTDAWLFEKVKKVERTGICQIIKQFWTNFLEAGQPQAWIIVRLDPVPPVPGLPPQEWPPRFSAKVGS